MDNTDRSRLEAMLAYENKNKEEAQREMASSRGRAKADQGKIIQQADAVIEILNRKLSAME